MLLKIASAFISLSISGRQQQQLPYFIFFCCALNFNRNESRDDFIFAFKLRIVISKYQSSMKNAAATLSKLEIGWNLILLHLFVLCWCLFDFAIFSPLSPTCHIFIFAEFSIQHFLLLSSTFLMDSFHVLNLMKFLSRRPKNSFFINIFIKFSF